MKIGIILGRFAPIHKGHEVLFEAAWADSEKLIVVMGSANDYPDTRTPWTWQQRVEMIKLSGVIEGRENDVVFVPLNDVKFHDCGYEDSSWAVNFCLSIRKALDEELDIPLGKTLALTLFGHTKEGEDFLAELAKDVGINYQEVALNKLYEDLCATSVREAMFEYEDINYFPFIVRSNVRKYLVEYQKTEEFSRLKDEYNHIQDCNYPQEKYPRIDVTADIIVVTEDEDLILLIKRGGIYGKGSWAMPGGYVDANETTEQAAIRELKEETGVDINTVCDYYVVDNPKRDLRGRIITHVFIAKLLEQEIVAGDDAKEAKWVGKEEFKEMYKKGLIFADHGDIISTYFFY